MKAMSRLRDPAEYVSKAKHRWAGHIMRRTNDRWTKNSGMDSSQSKMSSREPPTRGIVAASELLEMLGSDPHNLPASPAPRKPMKSHRVILVVCYIANKFCAGLRHWKGAFLLWTDVPLFGGLQATVMPVNSAYEWFTSSFRYLTRIENLG
ncbi:unnamed protein product [Strongylus vulgaris]|uniref:Uncharacterized protein n=1 Tax=Strongylus vulgaris TaxID=40348 RepID=A0A3P7JMR1_STRVU|nr:unnamed protein product [Strongylus vulgaris]